MQLTIFIGHTRFSLYVPDSTAWVASSQGDAQGYRDHLFSDERLDPRAKVFFDYSLPQIDRAIKAHDVLHVVSFSPELPPKYRAMLMEASAKYAWLVLDEQVDRVSTADTYELVQGLRTAKSDGPNVFASYRLDDDDLLPTSYFDRMAKYVTAANVGFYVSFGLGITAFQFENKFSFPRLVKERMFTAGLLSVCRARPDGGIVRPPSYQTHSHADASAPVIVDSRQIGFFWNRNAQQDTAQKHLSNDSAISMLQLFLSKLPRVDEDGSLLEEFPVLTEKYQRPNRMVINKDLSGASDLSIDFTPDVREIDVEVVMNNAEGIRQNNALIELSIRSKSGDLPDSQTMEQLKRFGIYKLNKGNDLFFKYIPTLAIGPSVEEVRVSVPSPCEIKSATVVPWGDGSALKIEQVYITTYSD